MTLIRSICSRCHRLRPVGSARRCVNCERELRAQEKPKQRPPATDSPQEVAEHEAVVASLLEDEPVLMRADTEPPDTLPDPPAAEPLTEPERHILSLARGPETTWVAPPVGERTVDNQRTIRTIEGLRARGYLDLTRCGPDGEDNRYRITDAGRRALGD